MAYRLMARRPFIRAAFNLRKCMSTTSSPNLPEPQSSSAPPTHHKFDSKWLSKTKQRLAKCMQFGLKPEQALVAGDISQQVAGDWRELVAGGEGFLTCEKRQGLSKHNVAWGEMDVMGRFWSFRHVNNVMYVRYAETGRVNWTRNFAMYHDSAHEKQWLEMIGSTGIGLILKSIKIDYKFPMTYPDQISVYHKLVHAPPSLSSPNPNAYSDLVFDVVILSEAKQRVAARCHEVVVLYDYRVGKKVSELPQYMIDQFRHTWDLQQEAKRINRQRMQEIDDRIRDLEVQSWDHNGAVEDMGSAG
ncbi:hypothetical protein LOZ58_004456 [Ophidiomyces ophidiicola]|nr:hypothetical protein LOZ58_004456 [Ophidiomyces ophidiicola]